MTYYIRVHHSACILFLVFRPIIINIALEKQSHAKSAHVIAPRDLQGFTRTTRLCTICDGN